MAPYSRNPVTVDWCGHLVTRRTANVLRAENIHTIAALKELSFTDLLRFYGCGVTSATEARRIVEPTFQPPASVHRLVNTIANKGAWANKLAARNVPEHNTSGWTPADIQRGA